MHMVSSKSLLGVGLLLLSSYASAAAIEETNPTGTNVNLGPIIKAEYNPVTGGADIVRGPPVNKRGYPPRPPPPPSCPKDVKSLVTLLRNKNQEGFCKAYIDLHPVVYKTVTVTICGKQNQKCTPKTVTTVIPKTRTVTNTVTAETPTVTVDVTATESITTTDTITITSTVSIPPAAGPPLVGRHDNYPKIPSYLKDCPPARLSSACSSLVRDYIKTTTITKTKTITGTAPTITSSATSTLATQTQTATVTPAPETFTTTVATTTITIAAPETKTTTTTVCPRATSGVSGIAVSPPGHLEGANAADAVGCCTACFNNPGCVGWAFLGSGFCFYGIGAPPNSGAPTAQCPFGLGTFSLGTGGPQELSGGPGQCFSE